MPRLSSRGVKTGIATKLGVSRTPCKQLEAFSPRMLRDPASGHLVAYFLFIETQERGDAFPCFRKRMSSSRSSRPCWSDRRKVGGAASRIDQPLARRNASSRSDRVWGSGKGVWPKNCTMAGLDSISGTLFLLSQLRTVIGMTPSRSAACRCESFDSAGAASLPQYESA